MIQIGIYFNFLHISYYQLFLNGLAKCLNTKIHIFQKNQKKKKKVAFKHCMVFKYFLMFYNIDVFILHFNIFIVKKNKRKEKNDVR